MKQIMGFIAIVLLLSGCCHQTSRLESNQIINARKACVEVIVNKQIKGTGAFISADGLIITASHLFNDDNCQVTILTQEKRYLEAKLIRRHRTADLALVQITNPNTKFPFLPIAKEQSKIGEWVGCFGAALWNPVMLLDGRMANDEINYCEYPSANGYLQCAFTASAIPGLASGGPWINENYELVGVQSGHLLDQGKDAGIALVARLDDINLIIASEKSVNLSDIGAWIWPLWTTDKAIIDKFPNGTKGLLINSLHQGSTLKDAGIKPHELILSCNGTPCHRRSDLLKIVRALKPGTVVTLKIMDQQQKVREVKVPVVGTEPGNL